tara:strand:- start:582 stop:845 length:264 start_codon:yes stop_codon:yes gene_type:complete
MTSLSQRLFGRKSKKSPTKLEKLEMKKKIPVNKNLINYKEESKITLDEEYMKHIKPQSSPAKDRKNRLLARGSLQYVSSGALQTTLS